MIQLQQLTELCFGRDNCASGDKQVRGLIILLVPVY